jgi:hypothetical protein
MMLQHPAISLALFALAQIGPIEVSHKRQLFLDDYLIASMSNVKREIHPAEKHPANPLLWPEKPWEGKTAVVYGSVIRDGGKYRMWYQSEPGVSYAESDDGIRWTRPGLDVVPIDGTKTNIVLLREAKPGQPGVANFYEVFGVHKDPCDPDPARRYKMGFLSLQRGYKGPREDPYHRGQRRGLGVAGSPDGIRWTLIDNWATESICDGATHWTFDPARCKYVLYGRTKFISPEVAKAWANDPWVKKHFWGRSVARVESADFLKWDFADPANAPVVMTVDTKDAPGTEVYSMLVFPYEDVYIGLVQAFYSRPESSLLDIQLAVSRDGVRFARVCDSLGNRVPFIPCGGIGSWDRFNNSLANNPPLLVGDELRFYYGGRTYRHSPYDGNDRGEPAGGIGLAAVKRDRFVSLAASFDGGLVITRPLKLMGRSLHLNAKSDFGRIAVQVIAGNGRVVAESKPIRTDATDVRVEWDKAEPNLANDPISLRITLSNARLFSLWCEG